MKKMKKALSTLLAATMVMSMNITAFADLSVDTNGDGIADTNVSDAQTVTINKYYYETNEDTTSPEETFSFIIKRTAVKDAADGVTKENMPIPTLSTISYGEEGASQNKNADGEPNGTKAELTVTLPSYTSVGVYTYTINEIDAETAGVTYFTNDITLVVTVLQDTDGHLRVAAVHTEAANEGKSDDFVNEYSAGSLEITKTVTGQLGDKAKEFDIEVTFTAPVIEKKDGTLECAVKADISCDVNEYTVDWDANNEWVIDEEAKTATATKTITLTDGTGVVFTNIPYGVTYTVDEADYTTVDKGGYDVERYRTVELTDTTVADVSNTEKRADGVEATINAENPNDKVDIVNNKGAVVDTGIILDSAPYILLLAFAAMGVFAVVNKKREEEF